LRHLDWLSDFDVFDKARARLRREFLWEVLETNPLGYFVGHRVRRHTYIYAFSTRILHYFLVVELELFREIVNSYLLLTCRHS